MIRTHRFVQFLARSGVAFAAPLLACLLLATPAMAQGLPVPTPEASQDSAGPSAEALDELIVTLESETGRSELIEQLKALKAAREADDGKTSGEAKDEPGFDGAAFIGAVTNRIRQIAEQFVESAQIVAAAPNIGPWIDRQLSDPELRASWVAAAWKIAAVLVIAILAEFFAKSLLAHPRRLLETRDNDDWGERTLVLVARTILDLVPVAVFALAAEAALSLLDPRAETAAAARALVMANVLVRAVLAVARMAFAPRVSRLRFLPIGDESANYAYVWVRRFANVGLYGGYGIGAAVILGLPAAGGGVLQQLLGLVLVGMAIALILQVRETVRDVLAGKKGVPGSSLRARLADIWHVAAIIYVIVLFCIWLLDLDGGFTMIGRASAITLIAVVAARLLVFGFDQLLDRIFSLSEETREQYPGLQVRANRYLSIVHGIVRAAVYIIALLVVAEAWGLAAFAWLASETGRGVLGTVAQILIVALLSVIVLEIASAAIERYMRRAQDNGNVSARVQTLLPLLRNVLRVTIAILATLIVLSEIGINIGPLLAGAGVAGLAIGFGSQKLVQDVITGMFIIIEDTISVGDVVRVAGHVGLCQAISIRTITLRDLSGTVHTVPFSDVTSIENLTKDFSYALMDVGVAYREDTDAVIEILHEVAEDLAEDPEYGEVMLEPLEVLGVDEFADSAVVIKVRIKTQPIKQWMVKREFNRRMKKAFDANGIEIPFPHTTLYFGEDREGGAPPAHVLLEKKLAADAGDAEDETGEASAAEQRSDTRGADLPE